MDNLYAFCFELCALGDDVLFFLKVGALVLRGAHEEREFALVFGEAGDELCSLLPVLFDFVSLHHSLEECFGVASFRKFFFDGLNEGVFPRGRDEERCLFWAGDA